MEERELINNYQNKDEIAQEILINKYEGLIWYVVHQYITRFHISMSYKDDLFQEGLIAFDKAVNMYDESRKASLTSLAMICIRRRINTFISRNYLRNNPYNTISLDSYVNEEKEYNYHMIIAKEDNHLTRDIDISKIEKLNEFERLVLQYRLEGFSYKEIADLLNTQPKKIDNVITGIKRRVKNYKNKGHDFLDNDDVIVLDDLEKKVYMLRKNGVSYKDIADKLQIDVKKVTNAMNRIRRKTNEFRITETKHD